MDIPGFKIEKKIGQGGMATAYLAVQESLGRRVVLKILDTANAGSAEGVERFLKEGRLVASLNHPYIITTYDIGIREDLVFISMEYIEGGDLKQRMHDYVEPNLALDLLLKIGGALDAVHKHGIIHRDVKPANILFRNDKTPLLTDFGIAKQMEADNDLTSTGIFLGSPNYMSPEQAGGGGIDGRADIYSLGVIFFEMLTGEKPYKGKTVVDVIVQHKQSPVPMLPPGLEDYQDLLNLMMAKDRSQRFRDASSMLDYIRKQLDSGEVGHAVTMAAKPDFDITGTIEETIPHRRLADTQSDLKQPVNQSMSILMIVLIVSMTIFAVLSYMTKQAREGAPVIAPVIQKMPMHITPPSEFATRDPASDLPSDTEVLGALEWLAKHSLVEYRLVSPPKDNAYYYYSRLLELQPQNSRAMKGMLSIADQFAHLAETELANNNLQLATNYISLGQQIDPNNKTLGMLEALAQEHRKSFIDWLLSPLQ